MGLVEITDFTADGWPDPKLAAERARWCCCQLERGEIVVLRDFPVISQEERDFLTQVRQTGSGFFKNISYQSQSGRLRGFARRGTDAQSLRRVLTGYADRINSLATRLLAPYAAALEVDLTSFRPIEERGRNLRGRSRNDLIHIDSFPTRPARGRRILRFFTNIHPSEPRVWITAETLAAIAPRMALDAGLADCAAQPDGFSRLKTIARAALRPIGIKLPQRSAYDNFMLAFHDYLKANALFQRDCRKQFHEFPPASTWIVFTDMVPHAVLSGQYALEHTYFVPVTAMVTPEKSPLRILESIARTPLA
jgi:hypothetical protein